MKKLFLITSLLVSFVATSAFAKTEGLYVGLDVINTDVRYYEVYNQNDVINGRERSYSNNSIGIGANFKYAVNFNNAFIALGGIFERNDTKASNRRAPTLNAAFQFPQSIHIKDRYGIKGDFGYDVTNNIAPYFTFGYAMVDYVAKNFTITQYPPLPLETETRILNRATGSLFYGAGVKFDFSKNISLSLEYTTQNIRAKTQVPYNSGKYTGHYRTRIDVAKLGISYKF
jgi:opacity protein-like surface antigen